tara:strand:+ start:3236 stop:3682 length:447 start_codon:yes stop_codon:yes gene_type:complete
MEKVEWTPVVLDSENEDETPAGLEMDASALHQRFIRRDLGSLDAAIQADAFVRHTSELVEMTREAGARILASELSGASLDATPMHDGIHIHMKEVPVDGIKVFTGYVDATEFIRIDREGLESIVTPLPSGISIANARFTDGGLDIHLE